MSTPKKYSIWRSWGIWLTLIPLLALLTLAVVAPYIWSESATQTDIYSPNAASSAEHLLGTDNLGRDVLSRILVATRLSVGMAMAAAGIGALVGCSYGIAAALTRGRLRSILLRGIDMAQALPGILVAVLFAAIAGPGTVVAVVAVGLASSPIFARVTSSLIVTEMGQEYFANARVVGVPNLRLVWKYILPAVGAPIAILATAEVGISLVAIASVSFLGLGVQLPEYDWGRLLIEGVSTIRLSPGLVLGSSAAIAFAGLAFGVVGELAALRINPELRQLKRPRRGPRLAPVDPVPAHSSKSSDALISVKDLSVSFPNSDGEWITPVENLSFEIGEHEIVGLVGESGSGKSISASALAGLLPDTARVTASSMTMEGVDLLGPQAEKARRRMAMVFQDPMSSLNPLMSIGRQVTEARRVHLRERWRAARQHALERLREVRISAPERRLQQRPHELSGGMRQRVVIGMGLTMSPKLLIADEPTTALDVTVQARVLTLLRELNEKEGMVILLISHDLGAIAEICSRVMVMKDGELVENSPIDEFLAGPKHPYSQRLLESVPRLSVSPREHSEESKRGVMSNG